MDELQQLHPIDENGNGFNQINLSDFSLIKEEIQDEEQVENQKDLFLNSLKDSSIEGNTSYMKLVGIFHKDEKMRHHAMKILEKIIDAQIAKEKQKNFNDSQTQKEIRQHTMKIAEKIVDFKIANGQQMSSYEYDKNKEEQFNSFARYWEMTSKKIVEIENSDEPVFIKRIRIDELINLANRAKNEIFP